MFIRKGIKLNMKFIGMNRINIHGTYSNLLDFVNFLFYSIVMGDGYSFGVYL